MINVMKVPPGLLGASLLVWGWQLQMGSIALLLAVLVEVSHGLDWRWQLQEKDVNRTVDGCSLLFLVFTGYLLLTREPAEGILTALAWLPLLLLPLPLLQNYSNWEQLPLTALSMQERRLGRRGRTVDVGYPYFLICLLAASNGNRSPALFYLLVLLLWAWALWPLRSTQRPPALWLGLLLLAGVAGYYSHIGLQQTQRALEERVSDWLLAWFIGDINPDERVTAMGSIGRLKSSSRIVLRVTPVAGPAPALLRLATYDTLQGTSWLTRTGGFESLAPTAKMVWELRPPAAGSAVVTILHTLPGRNEQGPLALPLGAAQIGDIPAAGIERNLLGTVRALGIPALVRYRVTYDPAGDLSPPGEADLRLPSGHAEVLAEVGAELQLATAPLPEVPIRLQQFFADRFSYSLDLTAPREGMPPLEDFLRHTRRGHCEYFASATVLLLRWAGIPARYVSGFSVQEYSVLERRYLVRERHAHAWAIAYLDGHWQAVDTTPPVWEEIDAAGDTVLTDLYDLVSWLWARLGEGRMDAGTGKEHAALVWLLPPLVLVLAWRLRRRQRLSRVVGTHTGGKTAPEWTGNDSECYRVLEWYRYHGWERQPGETLKAGFDRFAVAMRGEQDRRLHAILELHYRYRFDPAGLDAMERDELRRRVEEWLRVEAATGKG